MTETLEHMIRKSSRVIDRIWKIQGQVLPMVHMVLADGQEEITGFPLTDAAQKDAMFEKLKELFASKNVVRYLFVVEAWTLIPEDMPEGLSDEEMKQVQRLGIRNHPKRGEAVVFSGEDIKGGYIQAHRRIRRPTDGRAPYLEDLKIISDALTVQGRLVGLLRKSDQTTH